MNDKKSEGKQPPPPHRWTTRYSLSLAVVESLGEVQRVLVSQRGDLAELVIRHISSGGDLSDGQSPVQDVRRRVSGQLLELDWDVDPEELVEVQESSSNADYK